MASPMFINKLKLVAVISVISVWDCNGGKGFDDKKFYGHHQLILANPSDDESKLFLHDYVRGGDVSSCDFLRAPRINTQPTQILCPNNEATSKLTEKLLSLNIEHDVWKQDTPFKHTLEKREALEKGYGSSITDFEHYPRYEEIEFYLQNLARDYPDFIKRSVKGQTIEGRNITVMKIGTSPSGDETRAVWFDAGIHAREWVSPTSGLYTIHQIIQNHLNSRNGNTFNEDVVGIDWYIMPLLNPDGYEYSHTHDRMWRKNRSPEASGCFGVDLMRNFDVAGFGVGASSNPCSNVYKGKNRNSETETQIASQAILDNARNIRVALSLHSIGQSWLTSWGYRTDPPVDNAELLQWGNEAADAIKSLYGTKYDVGSAGSTLYLAGGAIDDFSKAVAKIPYAATVELSGTDRDGYGFMMPEKYIRRIGEEMWEGMKVSARYARKSELGPSKAAEKEELNERRWLAQNIQD